MLETSAIDSRPVLVTGATGYLGGRLVPRLLERGLTVRCLARQPRKLAGRDWASHPRLEIAAGDAGDPAAVLAALAGCRAAYYLVHSMMVAGETTPSATGSWPSSSATPQPPPEWSGSSISGGLGEIGPGFRASRLPP